MTAIAGSVGSLAGMATYTGMMAAAAAWGTASTGTAISSLSGAAAYNASMAMYGGGTLAAGGGGTATGVIVVGGAVVFVAVAATAAVMYVFHCHDVAQEWKRIGYTIDVLSDHIQRNTHYIRGCTLRSARPFRSYDNGYGR